MTSIDIHNARVEIASHVAGKALNLALHNHFGEILDDNICVWLKHDIIHAIQPFIYSNDVKDVEVYYSKGHDETKFDFYVKVIPNDWMKIDCVCKISDLEEYSNENN